MLFLQVLWDGHHVRGSPSRVQVDIHSSAANAIVIDANTLKMGIINEDVKTVIDTKKAGPGEFFSFIILFKETGLLKIYRLHRNIVFFMNVHINISIS